MSYKFVNECAQIDLNRHGLIEASAGTGKTYTIENLVIRLLKEKPDILLENILMVTFTEKATCELKIRIREKLEEELKTAENGGGVTQKIRDTLDSFDTASIYTIHGFCYTIIRDFAFENRSLFENEVINDAPLFDTLLKEQMRKVWPKTYKDYFPEILNLSGFNTKKERFLSIVVDIARRTFRPESGDEIRPDMGDKRIRQIRTEILESVMELKSITDSPPAFSEGYYRLNINGKAKKSLLEKIVVPLESYLSQVNEENFSLAKLFHLIEQIKNTKSSGRKGAESLTPQWLKKGPNPEVCPNLEEVIERIKNLSEIHTRMTYYLAVESIEQLQRDAVPAKQKNGWLSYDDMLTRVKSALYADNSSALLEKLRKKYKVAFVDEFQDTDPIQWDIFRRIFLDFPNERPENPLYLIGDPKQAIYSFRGADVYAYLTAKNEMERLSAAGKANLYSLAINWRSRPELIQGFNDLFCRWEWFPPLDQCGDFEIGYQTVAPPDKKNHSAMLITDNSHGQALNIIDLRGPASPKPAKIELARFIAAEIVYLVSWGGIKIRGHDGHIRPLDFGDISILVRGKPDVSLLEPELISRNIPYTFYKKPGLFASDEAIYLSLVFHAVLDPSNTGDVKKALLTPFFKFKPVDLYNYDEMQTSHPVRQLFFKWNDYARFRKWGLLFQSLIEDSGLLIREAETHDWERKYTNYRQIFEHLETVAYKKNPDFRGLSALLDSYRKETIGADDEDIHQIETEDRKVQIMTMHVSKGLQFPVVFIGGGLTRPFSNDYYVYHEYDEENPASGVRKIIDLSKENGKEFHEAEKDNEDKRLFYVALTRAQLKLYVPFYPATSKHSWVGPVCGFLAESITSAFPENKDNPLVAWIKPGIHDDPALVPVRIGEQPVLSVHGIDKTWDLLPSCNDYQQRKIIMESFSSLHSRIFRSIEKPEHTVGFQAIEEKGKEDDEGSQTTGSADEIPGGTDVGSMFHDILEHIDFDAVLKDPNGLLEMPDTRDIIMGYMETYQVAGQWQTHVCRIVTDTLTTPVNAVEEGFLLGNLKREERVHEVEFYYPFSLSVDRDLKIPGCEVEKSTQRVFIRGFVDLIFHHEGKYYIADWKSNRIDGSYHQQAMEENMKEAGYPLQYKIYTVATLRWLKQALGGRFDSQRQFGGIFYFYIRGMGTGKGAGIYYVSPDDLGPLELLEEEIAENFKL